MLDLALINCLALGRDELGLMLYSGNSPTWLARRVEDGRSHQELRDGWQSKVVAGGLPREQALLFLNERLAME